MTDDTPFLAAIRDHPDADGPRLVYADWLDERGDPRGEFIRLSCRYKVVAPKLGKLFDALLPVWVKEAGVPADQPPEIARVVRTVSVVGFKKSGWRNDYNGDTYQRISPRWFSLEYHRGFVKTVFVRRLFTFLDLAPALSKLAPVAEVKWNGGRHADGALPDCTPLKEWLPEGLAWTFGNDVWDILAVAMTQHLRRLAGL